MLNDWVHYPDRKCNVQITGIPSYKKVLIFILENNEVVEVNPEKLEPISLTDDILRRNGFKGDGYMYLSLGEGHHLEYYPYEHRLTRIWQGKDEWQNHAEVRETVFLCQCGYLHELQHAFKLNLIDKPLRP